MSSQQKTIYKSVNDRPFTAKLENLRRAKEQFKASIRKEDREIEEKLYEIESRLVKGNAKHYKNLINKSKLVRTSNLAAHVTSLKAKQKTKEDQESKLNTYIYQTVVKSKKIDDIKKEIKFYNKSRQNKVENTTEKIK